MNLHCNLFDIYCSLAIHNFTELKNLTIKAKCKSLLRINVYA